MMTNVCLLSIIVPVYNVRAVLTPLVKQLLVFADRNKGDVELIFVDDGATDGSATQVASLIADTPFARLIHQANAGLSAARNHGLDLAIGSYVWFIDGDDLLNTALLSDLLVTLRNRRPDLIQFGYVRFATVPPTKPTSELNWKTVTGHELFIALAENRLQNYAWAHICRRKLYQEAGVRFPEGLQFEDLPTTYKLFLASATALVTTAPIYYYRNRIDSTVNVVSERSMQDLWTIAQQIAEETRMLPDREHASRLSEMALLIALGRTLEGAETESIRTLRHIIVQRYCRTPWEHQGMARVKTRLRQAMMRMQIYVPLSRHRLRLRL